MQAAGGRVGAAAELTAGMELGENHFDARESGLRLDVHRDAAAVVVDFHGAVGMQEDLDRLAVARQCLIDGVVDDLPKTVHESTRIGGTDVHARTFTYRLEPFQDG